jgi:multidrug efflux system membrane fusion protein
MKKQHLGLLAGAALLILAGTWYFRSANGAETIKTGAGKDGTQPPATVSVITPARQDVPVEIAANGTVTPLQTVDLRAQTTATIRQVHIKEGQFVKAGTLMFSLDDRSDAANVDKARAQVVRDEATLGDVERQFKRSQDLFAQKFIAQSAVDTLKSQADAARAALLADQAALRASRVSAGYATITAPLSGRVGAINVYPGSLMQPATSLTTITQLDPISVAFTVPESALGGLLAAQKHGKVTVQAAVGAAPPISGSLSFVDNAVDAQSGTIRVKAVFDNSGSNLWPGQYVNTRVTVHTIRNAVVIPQQAIVTNSRGTFVYVAQPDQSARLVPVARLHAFGLNAAVSGLDGTEQVITDGKQNVRPGGKIRLAAKSAAAAVGNAS